MRLSLIGRRGAGHPCPAPLCAETLTSSRGCHHCLRSDSRIDAASCGSSNEATDTLSRRRHRCRLLSRATYRWSRASLPGSLVYGHAHVFARMSRLSALRFARRRRVLRLTQRRRACHFDARIVRATPVEVRTVAGLFFAGPPYLLSGGRRLMGLTLYSRSLQFYARIVRGALLEVRSVAGLFF